MKLIRWQFILSIVSIVAIFYVAFMFVPRIMQSRNITPINIDQRTIDQRQLSAVRDLKGTWEGKASFNAGQTGRCTLNESITLTINNQTENAISGIMTFTDLSGTPNTAGMRACNLGKFPVAITGDIVGTRIENINAGMMGTYAGTYTQDTITLNQTGTVDNGYGVRNVIGGQANLLRQ